MEKITIPLFFDEYERKYGDGLYPVVKKTDCISHFIEESFIFVYKKELNAWIQESNKNDIDGLDGDHGKELLHILNDASGVTGATKVYNSYKQLYPKVKY